jgi:hypothetical protein
VGDLVGCDFSHPCTISDKWPLLLAVDNDYCVRLILDVSLAVAFHILTVSAGNVFANSHQ